MHFDSVRSITEMCVCVWYAAAPPKTLHSYVRCSADCCAKRMTRNLLFVLNMRKEIVCILRVRAMYLLNTLMSKFDCCYLNHVQRYRHPLNRSFTLFLAEAVVQWAQSTLSKFNSLPLGSQYAYPTFFRMITFFFPIEICIQFLALRQECDKCLFI